MKALVKAPLAIHPDQGGSAPAFLVVVVAAVIDLSTQTRVRNRISCRRRPCRAYRDGESTPQTRLGTNIVSVTTGMATSRFFGAAAAPNRGVFRFGSKEKRKAGVPPSDETFGARPRPCRPTEVRTAEPTPSFARTESHDGPPLPTATRGASTVPTHREPSAMVEHAAGPTPGPKRSRMSDHIPKNSDNCHTDDPLPLPPTPAATSCNTPSAAALVAPEPAAATSCNTPSAAARVAPEPAPSLQANVAQANALPPPVILPARSEVEDCVGTAPPPWSDTASDAADLPMPPPPDPPDGCDVNPGTRGASAVTTNPRANADSRPSTPGCDPPSAETIDAAPHPHRGASHFFGRAGPDSATRLLSSFKDKRSQDCTICLGPLRSERGGIGELPCKHQFCFCCLSEWLKVRSTSGCHTPKVPVRPGRGCRH